MLHLLCVLLLLGTTKAWYTTTNCTTQFENVTVSGVTYYLSQNKPVSATLAALQCYYCFGGSLADLSAMFVNVGPLGESYYIGAYESTVASDGYVLVFHSRSVTEIVDSSTARAFICTAIPPPTYPTPTPVPNPVPVPSPVPTPPNGNGTQPLPPVPPPNGNGTQPLPPVPPPNGNGTQPLPPVPPPNGNGTQPLPPVPPPNGNGTQPLPPVPPPNGNGTQPLPPVPGSCADFTNQTIGGVVFAFSNFPADFTTAAQTCETCFPGSSLADVSSSVAATSTPGAKQYYVASYETTPPWIGYGLVWQGTSITELVNASTPLPFVCKLAPPTLALPSQCPNFDEFSIGGTSFSVAVDALYNWFTAQSVCMTCQGKKLAALDRAVLTELPSQPQISPASEYWVGSWDGANQESYMVLQGRSVTVRLPDSALRRVLCSE